jgi:hypothetical protein
MFTTEWRAWRVRQGDAFLAKATDPKTDLMLVPSIIAIAQAHYQAANIRSRPGESWLASKQQLDPDRDGDQHP